jgi:hypothetical protein
MAVLATLIIFEIGYKILTGWGHIFKILIIPQQVSLIPNFRIVNWTGKSRKSRSNQLLH